MRIVQGVRDRGMSAVVTERRPLFYAAGPDPDADRPAHVRAGSGLAVVGERIVVVQDDANFLALINPRTGRVDHATLPRGDGGARQFDDLRGNKEAKLDLEACVSFQEGDEQVFLAFGSGATGRRERIVWVTGLDYAEPSIEYIDGSLFYAKLRALEGFAPEGLNLEGVVISERGEIWFANRGTAREGRILNGLVGFDQKEMLGLLAAPVDARIPSSVGALQFDLGALEGVPLGITDLTRTPEGLLFVAAAEETANTVDDGPVAGSVLGVVTPDGDARWAPIVDEDGRLFPGKVEGVVAFDDRLYAVVDQDDPNAASMFCEVVLSR